jgi:cell division protein FtsA
LLPLAELLTGLETRIGRPNEHLGKSRIEVVKSPMYATTVGLVLAGYRPSLDDRLSRRLEAAAEQKAPVASVAAKPVAAPKPVAKPAPTSGGSGFFKSILDKTVEKAKGLLIDDFDDKQY